jgi:hypothetical protein
MFLIIRPTPQNISLKSAVFTAYLKIVPPMVERRRTIVVLQEGQIRVQAYTVVVNARLQSAVFLVVLENL